MKMAPLLALESFPQVQATLIHSGQHYDAELSDVFFQEFGLRQPDIHLGVGSGKQGEQTARILEGLERVFENGHSPGGHFDRVVVVGDVNSTMAAALAAAKLQIPVAHVEAGLRSLTDPCRRKSTASSPTRCRICCSSPSRPESKPMREGHDVRDVRLVGNLMIDTLHAFLPQARERNLLEQLGLRPAEYGVVTLHRPSNVDNKET